MIIKIKVTPETIRNIRQKITAIWAEKLSSGDIAAIIEMVIADLHLAASMDEEENDIKADDLPY